MHRRQFLTTLGALGASGLAGASDYRVPLLAQATHEGRRPDVIYVPTPDEVVDKMLGMAAVTARDVVYDLGCGDGRIVITAAQRYGAHGVGVDIDPKRIQEANANATQARVADKVRFIEGDLFKADISAATVVTLYLLTELNLRLRPKLMRELRPGTRVVSHAFAMGDWVPERKVEVGSTMVYLWRIPVRA